ncbi:MAG: hypothetical protein RLZZ383_2598 [Pseudomonadota bacterium]|jgi:hypothetical protein
MSYERPILSRYLDPVELVWLATARRLGLTVRRDPAIFSRTDGSGMLWLGPRDDLDADDTVAQMLLHEICHWVTNGVDTYRDEDWGFPLDDADDPREFACLRVQAALADRHGLRGMFGPTGKYRAYFDRIPPDPFTALDDSPAEAEIVRIARGVWPAVDAPPFAPHLDHALATTAAIRGLVQPFLPDYATEVDGDLLPSLWSR